MSNRICGLLRAGTVVLLLVLGATEAAAQVPLDCNSFLAANQFGQLFSVDPTNAASLFIGATPSTTEIEFDITNGILYGEGSDGDTRLFDIDPTTGLVNGLVVHPFGALNGMEYVGAVLYATFITFGGAPSTLVIVDVNTGNLTPVGLTGLGPISGLAYDPAAGVMWGVTAPIANLVTVNLTNGLATLVTPLVNPAGAQLWRVGSIEFGPDGNLYGGLTAFAPIMPQHLVRIDTTTGVATPVGDTGFSITGLTSCFSGLEVAIDIKPGSDPNGLNPRSKGLIPVAILTTSTADGDPLDFDATDVDPLSLAFGPAGAGIAHATGHVEDIDGDGDLDLVVHFPTEDTGIACGDTSATLTGMTFGGQPIEGTDSVFTAGCK